MVIYKITNKLNNKVYIGQTRRPLTERLWEHKNNKRYRSLISLAINKYGINNFIIEIIAQCENIKELNLAETHYISQYKCLAPKGYNLISFGEVKIISESTREIMSLSKKGKKKSPEWIKNQAKAQSKKIKCLNNNTTFDSITEAARLLGLSKGNISSVINGKYSHTKGFMFERVV